MLTHYSTVIWATKVAITVARSRMLAQLRSTAHLQSPRSLQQIDSYNKTGLGLTKRNAVALVNTVGCTNMWHFMY